MTKKILIISILLYCTNVFAQDTLFQFDFSVHPIHFDKTYSGKGNETSFSVTRNLKPSLTLCFPIHNKFSISTGLNLFKGSYEGFYNDSVEQIIDPTDPTLLGRRGYIYYNKVTRTEISIPLMLNYNLYYNKYFSTNISLGLEVNIWDNYSDYYEFYPISTTNTANKNKHFFNSPLEGQFYSPYLSATIKYFPMKHFGLLVRPFISYSFFDDYVLSSLGIGVCYR